METSADLGMTDWSRVESLGSRAGITREQRLRLYPRLAPSALIRAHPPNQRPSAFYSPPLQLRRQPLDRRELVGDAVGEGRAVEPFLEGDESFGADRLASVRVHDPEHLS